MVFAWQNTYNAESDEYKELMMLCNISGVRPVNMVTPISGEQMLDIMEAIPYSKLNQTARACYESLKNKLEHPEVIFKYNNNLGMNGLFNLNLQFIKQSKTESDWLLPKRDRMPFALAGGEIYFNRNVYGTMQMDFVDIDNDGTYGSTENYKEYTTNIIKKLEILHNVEFGAPHKAFVSAGYSGVNLTFGRDRVSLGNGNTGNMILGANLWYDDFFKASIENGPVSYDMTILSFENSCGSYDNIESHTQNPLKIEIDFNDENPRQLVFVHNFSYSPVKFLNLTITEGALTFGRTSLMDMRKLNPFMIIHDIFDYSDGSGDNLGNMNNFFGFEVGAALPYGYTLNGQAVFDQIQLGGEREDDDALGAQGFLLNVEKTGELNGGLGSCYAEVAYTSENLYLKQDNVTCGEYWNVDLIVGKKLFWATSTADDVSYLGYKHGPDTFTVGAGFDWENEKLGLDFDALYKKHGTQGIIFYSGQNDKTITYGDVLENVVYEHRLSFELGAKYELTDYASVEGNLGYTHAWNYRNLSGEKFDSLQFAIGVRMTPLEILGKLNKTM